MKNNALVVVDMLYDFIDGSLACQNADNAVRETLKFIDAQTKVTKNETTNTTTTKPPILNSLENLISDLN
ncbi:MAG: hypothetical protein IJ940_04495 [Bacteroidales bacterium]|nr:hypothetical protein [Bacteroidales bacterium]